MTESIEKIRKEKVKKSQNLKREKFVQLAENRTIRAIKAIRVIGNLSNRGAYDYNDEDVKKIVKALTNEIEALKSKMKNTERSDGVDFKL